MTWKSLLACCGGVRDHIRVKKLARELAGLALESKDSEPTQPPIVKSSPIDIEAFRQETTVKYPTFIPPPAQPPVDAPALKPPPAKLAQAYSPIPIRHHYHHDDFETHSNLSQSSIPFHSMGAGGGSGFRNPQPPTPAPSPPPGPKPKKQQYQTDQNRPFLFPFSRGTLGRKGKDARLIPFAIDEADKLYNKHMHISLALLQMWRTREDCMTFQSGLDHMPGSEGDFRPSTFIKASCPPPSDSSLADGHRIQTTLNHYLISLSWMKRSTRLSRRWKMLQLCRRSDELKSERRI